MRVTAQGGGCVPSSPRKQSAAPGVKARNGRMCKQASQPVARTSNHKAPTLTRTMVALFSDDGAFIGFDLFGRRSDARAFLRAGGA